MRGTQFADQLGADVRLAIRQARKHLSYSLTCMAVLAFGLAANTAVFSVVYSTILKPPPYPEPGRLNVDPFRKPEAAGRPCGIFSTQSPMERREWNRTNASVC